MSKIDELGSVFDAAYRANTYGIMTEVHAKATRAGIAAVVRAVRDEFGGRMKPAVIWDKNSVDFVFNQILGAAGDEVAGSSAREGEADGNLRAPSARSPATAPAPAVCEITAERDRLKAALQDCVDAYDFVIVDEYDRGWSSVSGAIHAARKALEVTHHARRR